MTSDLLGQRYPAPTWWEVAPLEDVASILDSYREPINNKERQNRTNGKKVSELFPYFGATGQVGYIDDYRLNGKYVLLGEDGAPFLEANKAKAYIAEGKIWVNNHAHILKPRIDLDFFCYYLNSVDYAPVVTGTTRLKLNQRAMRKIAIAVPPLAEQRRIVAKIEELFSELDNGVASLKAARAQLKTYRQSLLKAAFEGRLTEQWRCENEDRLESADQLLVRIRKEREARYEQRLEEWKIKIREWEAEDRASKKPKKPQKPSLIKGAEPFSSEELSSLPELPKGWTWAAYSDLCESIRNGISKAPKDGKGDKIFRISAVRPMAFDMEDFRRIDNSSGEFDAYFLKRGDIVFTRYNGSRNYVGVAAVFRSDEPYLYPDKLIKTRVEEEFVSPDYIEAAVNTGESRRFTESRIRTTAGQSGISGGDIKRIPVPLCSYEEQVVVADLLNSGLSRIQELDRSIEAAYRRSESLRQSLLKRAFEGKLVPHESDDEPASVLLERIRAEQGKEPKSGKGRWKANA